MIWCGTEICEERAEGGAAVAKRYFDQGVEFVTGTNAGTYYYAQDHLGSVRELVDTNGAVRARYDYDPWGRRTKLSGDLDADFGLTSHYYHQPSGLHLAMHRAYDADLGRWLSRDTIGERGPDGPNVYTYVRNNPIYYIDPDGKFAIVIAIPWLLPGVGTAIINWGLYIGSAAGGAWLINHYVNRRPHQRPHCPANPQTQPPISTPHPTPQPLPQPVPTPPPPIDPEDPRIYPWPGVPGT